MKKYLLLLIVVLVTLYSCTNDENAATNLTPNVSNIIQKNYNITTGGIFNSTNYDLLNNKIQFTTSTNNQAGQQSTSAYNYLGNRLNNITNSQNGIVNAIKHFVYNTSNKLVEYRSEGFNPSGQITSINKEIFTHTSDTIFTQWTRSVNNAGSFSLISSTKIVLDSHGNQTFIEVFDNLNNETTQIIKTYDSNNNIIMEAFYTLDENGIPINVMTNSITYNANKNTLYFVTEKTFGKNVLMLLYPYAGSAVNSITVKSYCPNNVNTFSTTFGDGTITSAITNTTNQNGYSEYDEFSTYNSNVLYSKFTYEYYFN